MIMLPILPSLTLLLQALLMTVMVLTQPFAK
jgi:hypothetical protein